MDYLSESGISPLSGTEGLQDLHKKMRRICAAVQANGSAERQTVVERFRDIICGQNRGVGVEWYGSSSTGLFVEESDVDLVILVPVNQLQEGHVEFLREVYYQLKDNQRIWHLCGVEINSDAAVPFVKAMDIRSGLEVQITCAKLGSRVPVLENSEWIRSAVVEHPSVTVLVVILKNLLRQCGPCGLHNINAGGVSSYVLVLMVISYLQTLQNDDPNRHYNLGYLLLGFLELYGYDFDYENKAIVLTNGGRIVDKYQLRWMTDPLHHQLIIQDPVDPTKNAAKQSLGGLGRVREVFKKTHETLKQEIDEYLFRKRWNDFPKAIFWWAVFAVIIWVRQNV